MKNNFATFILSIGSILAASLGCAESPKKPAWQKAQAIAEALDHPSAITVDDKFIYYVTGGTIASLQSGTSGVWKIPISGGQPVQLFKGYSIDENSVILPDTFVLGTDKDYVYWSSGAIWRTPKTGGESIKLTVGKPTEMVLDETDLYWHNFGGENAPPTPIYNVSKTGGEAKAFTDPVITSGIALDSSNLYWAQSDGIYKKPKNGGAPTKIHSPAEKQFISGLAADVNNLYFTEGSGRNSLWKISKQGGEPQKIAAEINTAHKFYAAGDFLYFVKNEGSFETSLNKVSTGGGEITQIDSGYLRSFAIGMDKIFITDIAKIYSLAR